MIIGLGELSVKQNNKLTVELNYTNIQSVDIIANIYKILNLQKQIY